MPEFLLFTLYGPLAASGDIAVGERRMGWDRPGKSAVLGLVAAALGLTRAEGDAQRALDASLAFAVRLDAPGMPVVDYHTAQVPPARRGRFYRTRREELESDDLETILSQREYRTDMAATVALWPRGDKAPARPLDEIKGALESPRFALYLGRRSCPLAWPLDPAIVVAATLVEALAKRPLPPPLDRALHSRSRGDGKVALAFDDDPPVTPAPERRERRRDALVDRLRWHFAERAEGVVRVALPTGDAA